jgi:hypothetical protein
MANRPVNRLTAIKARVVDAFELLKNARDVPRTSQPNTKAFLSAYEVGPEEAEQTRTIARAFIAQAESGNAPDSTDYLRKRIEARTKS